MLADPRRDAFVENFAGQWLFLRNLDAVVPVQSVFPDFDDTLRQAFRRETELFFESIVREDRSALDLLRADYTFVNERLARALRHSERQGQPLPPRDAAGGQPRAAACSARAASSRSRRIPIARRRSCAASGSSRTCSARRRRRRRPTCRRSSATHRSSGSCCRCASGWSEHRAQPGVRELPRDDGPARLRARELRRGRRVAHARTSRRRRSTRPARCPTARRSTAPRTAAARCSRSDRFVIDAHREAADVRARPRRRVLRCAGRARASSATRRADDYPLLVPLDSRRRAEPPFQMQESGKLMFDHQTERFRGGRSCAASARRSALPLLDAMVPALRRWRRQPAARCDAARLHLHAERRRAELHRHRLLDADRRGHGTSSCRRS